MEYETANPGQDFDDLEAGAFDPEKDDTRPVVSPTHERTGSELLDNGDERPVFSHVRNSQDGTAEGGNYDYQKSHQQPNEVSRLHGPRAFEEGLDQMFKTNE